MPTSSGEIRLEPNRKLTLAAVIAACDVLIWTGIVLKSKLAFVLR